MISLQDERASRKTATPVSSEQTSKSDFDQVLRLLVQRSRPDSANVSLDDARRTLDELKSAVRLMEQRLRDAIDSTEVNNNNSNNNDNDYDYKLADNNNASHPVKSPSGPAHQVVDVVDRVLRSNGATSDEKRQSHATVERFHRLTSDVHVTDDVMQLLRTVLEMTFAAGRKRRPKETVPSPVVHRYVQALFMRRFHAESWLAARAALPHGARTLVAFTKIFQCSRISCNIFKIVKGGQHLYVQRKIGEITNRCNVAVSSQQFVSTTCQCFRARQ